MMTQRLLHWLVGLFPASYRSTRSEELHDALTITAPRGWNAVREAGLLGLAAGTAWRRFLITPTGMRNSLFFGLMAWLGVLIATGPIGRLQAFDAGGYAVRYTLHGTRAQYLLAAGLMVASFVLLLWKRSFAAVAGGFGILWAAVSTRVGEWRLDSALLYEARWLGLALLAALIVRGGRRVHWVVLASAVPGATILLGPFHYARSGANYRFKLAELFDTYQGSPVCPAISGGPIRRACTDVLVSVFGGDTMAALVAMAGVLMLIGAWCVPALAVVFVPAAFRLTLANPAGDAAVLLAYLLIVVVLRGFVRIEIGRGGSSTRSGDFRLTLRLKTAAN